jgi:hypothetical protein
MFEVGDYDKANGNFTFGKGGNQGARGNNEGGDFYVQYVFLAPSCKYPADCVVFSGFLLLDTAGSLASLCAMLFVPCSACCARRPICLLEIASGCMRRDARARSDVVWCVCVVLVS